jgi:hypothetical protein
MSDITDKPPPDCPQHTQTYPTDANTSLSITNSQVIDQPSSEPPVISPTTSSSSSSSSSH